MARPLIQPSNLCPRVSVIQTLGIFCALSQPYFFPSWNGLEALNTFFSNQNHFFFTFKGPGKRGHIFADPLLPMMFLGLRKLGNICCGQKMFLNKIRNIFCVPDTKFVSATNAARAGKRGNISADNSQGSKFIFGFGSTCATRCKFLGALPKFQSQS